MIRYKYPRTAHLPWSPGAANDDVILSSVDHFVGKRVVVSVKMDGESTSIYSDGYMHARSIDGHGHESQDWVKANIVPYVAPLLPAGWRICGENLYAEHSLRYEDLRSFFMVFSIWDANNVALSWADTLFWLDLITTTIIDMGGDRPWTPLITTPVIYEGEWDEKLIRGLWDASGRDTSKLVPQHDEGYVVRIADAFRFEDFSMSLAKFVRKGHVQTKNKHWKKTWKPNGMFIDQRMATP